jgi:multidrug resistance protein, MATE family
MPSNPKSAEPEAGTASDRLLPVAGGRAGSCRAVLRLAVPLILGQGSMTIQQIVDRVFLAWLSPEAVAAAMPAGLLNFTLSSLAVYTAGYVSAFVAQYHGARQDDRIGPVAWQGLHFSAAAGFLALPLLLVSAGVFARIGHPPGVRALERVYFDILLAGVFPAAASAALAGLFSGLGRVWAVAAVTAAATAFNAVFDYGLVFGAWGLPRMGMAGAALATVLSQVVSLAAYGFLLLRTGKGDPYRFRSGWRFDAALFRRLLRFGFPNGLHVFLEMSGFTMFLFLVGGLGTDALAATNIAFSINHLAFLPMTGFGMAAAILVGRHLGAGRPDLAEAATRSAFGMTFGYMALAAVAFCAVPGLFTAPFAANSDPVRFAPVAAMVADLLKFVALYSLFDTANVVFASAIKGAGDTRFVMWASMILSWTIMVAPSFVALRWFDGTIYSLWAFATAYIAVIGVIFALRFRRGRWKGMRVIEPVLVVGPAA